MDKKSAENILEIYEDDLFKDVGFQEPKSLTFMFKIHDELKCLDLPNEIRIELLEQEKKAFDSIEKLNIQTDRYKFSDKLTTIYFNFVCNFLIKHKVYFMKKLNEELLIPFDEPKQLPLYLSYIFWLENKDTHFSTLSDPYKEIFFVPSLYVLPVKDCKQKLLLFVDHTSTWAEFSTFIFNGKSIKKINKLNHSFTKEELKKDKAKKQMYIDDFANHQFLSSEQYSATFYEWNKDDLILTLTPQGTKTVKNRFKLKNDEWIFLK